MSTEHLVHSVDDFRVSLDENSGRFCIGLEVERPLGLGMYTEDNTTVVQTAASLDAEQVVAMALNMLRVASYHMENGAVEAAIANFKSTGAYSW